MDSLEPWLDIDIFFPRSWPIVTIFDLPGQERQVVHLHSEPTSYFVPFLHLIDHLTIQNTPDKNEYSAVGLRYQGKAIQVFLNYYQNKSRDILRPGHQSYSQFEKKMLNDLFCRMWRVGNLLWCMRVFLTKIKLSNLRLSFCSFTPNKRPFKQTVQWKLQNLC